MYFEFKFSKNHLRVFVDALLTVRNLVFIIVQYLDFYKAKPRRKNLHEQLEALFFVQ